MKQLSITNNKITISQDAPLNMGESLFDEPYKSITDAPIAEDRQQDYIQELLTAGDDTFKQVQVYQKWRQEVKAREAHMRYLTENGMLFADLLNMALNSAWVNLPKVLKQQVNHIAAPTGVHQWDFDVKDLQNPVFVDPKSVKKEKPSYHQIGSPKKSRWK